MIITGHQDGRVKIWKVEFEKVQISRARLASTASARELTDGVIAPVPSLDSKEVGGGGFFASPRLTDTRLWMLLPTNRIDRESGPRRSWAGGAC